MTERTLEGRTALVTGSTSGIGLGIALLYAQAGAKVMLNGLGRPDDIARARGVTVFAQETGLSRETIYKAFRPGGNPTLDTLAKATKALGLRLAVVPA